MTQRGGSWSWPSRLTTALGIGGAIIASSGNCTLAQIKPDATLGSERSVITPLGDFDLPLDQIEGGAKRGTNLFHSFEEFNIGHGRGIYFSNPAGIKNILSRVTGSNRSDIQGTLGVLGNANLFLINPNGIIFGPNSSLDVNGSFVATTADAVQFENQGFFNMSEPNAPPLLTVSPSAFLFNQIAHGSIENSSIAPAGSDQLEFSVFGLRVPDGQSLLLLGGDINMNSGHLNAFGGRVELGGVTGAGTVGLNRGGKTLSLIFSNDADRSDVSLTNVAGVVVAAGNGGSVTVNARNLEMTGGSFLLAGIINGLGSDNSEAGNIEVNATGAINLNDESFIGNQVLPETNGVGGDVSISASTLLVKDGAQVDTSNFGAGKGGSLTVNAQDVQLIGESANGIPSGLIATAQENSTGDAGDLTINTNTLLVKDGAQVGAGTLGAGKGGSLSVDAQDVQLIGESAGSLYASGLFASALPNSTGDAGDLTINTDILLVQDGAKASVSSQGTGNAGNLEVEARSIQMNNQGALTAQSALGQGGSIMLNVQNLLIIQRSSAISAISGTPSSGGNAGNITIDTDLLVAIENSDIIANAFAGPGANVQITAQGIFGSQAREQLTPDSDITASSQLSINTSNDDPSSGLVTLPEEVVDVSGLIAQTCPAGSGPRQSKFVVTGRGGVPPNPGDILNTDAVQVNLVTLNPKLKNRSSPDASTNLTSSSATPIVEAQGWVRDANGNVVLTAQAPTVTPHSSWGKTNKC